MPSLPTTSQKTDSILIGANNANHLGEEDDTLHTEGGKWEDEEEKRFFEDVQDLKDFVPKSVLGVENEEGVEGDKQETEGEARQKERLEREKEEIKKLEEELEGLKLSEGKDGVANGDVANKTETEVEESKDEDDEWVRDLRILALSDIIVSVHQLPLPVHLNSRRHLSLHNWLLKVPRSYSPHSLPDSQMLPTALWSIRLP